MVLNVKNVIINVYKIPHTYKVEVIHERTGIKAHCDRYTSIHRNREIAFKKLELLVDDHNKGQTYIER